MQSPIQDYLESLRTDLARIDGGKLADYIPELTKADPSWFGICLVTMDGAVYAAGDDEQKFTIQSISKPFVYATALADRGLDFVSRKVGVEPSGEAFNSISLDPQTGAPFNPMINAGAIATTSLVHGATPERQWQRIAESLDVFVGHKTEVDEQVYRSESATGFRNRAIAWMLKNFGIIDGDPMACLENYFRQCSVLVSCRDLAFMAATLANDGVHPVTGERALPREHVGRVLSVMATCGMYDFAGSWLYEVGMPAKSGVGGGIIAVLPGRFGIGVFSPPLDAKGNSVRGIEVCRSLSRDFGLTVFSRQGEPSKSLGRVYTAAEAPSRRHATQEARSFLDDHAYRIKYLCLHGYLQVDGVEYVIRRMLAMAADTHSFILDMHQVVGISDNAAQLLHDARRRLSENGIALVFSRIHGRQSIAAPLRRSAGRTGGYLSFEDNDLAAEWCESRLIGELATAPANQSALAGSAIFRGLSPELMESVERLTTPKKFGKGERILTTDQADGGDVFFVESGHVSVVVPLADGAHQRIASFGPGMSFGEMALLGQTARSATVFADTEVNCRVLEYSALERLTRDRPELRIAVLENLARDLAEKLRRANQWISALA
ncbi:MAG TPA: glutaminase A [Pelomicrobium sp.]|nr:glutaminase A [Pelomicrobium sp.]